MSFEDFAYEFMEADEAQPAASAPRRTSPAPAPRPATTSGTASRPSTTGRPANTTPRSTQPAGARTTQPSSNARATQPSQRQTSAPARTGATTTPAQEPRSSASSAASSLSNFFAQISPYAQQGFDFAKLGMQIGQQFQQPGGQPQRPPDDPAAVLAGQPPSPAVAGFDTTGAATPTGMPPPGPPGLPDGAAGMDQFAAFLQALRQQQAAPQPAPAPPQAAAPSQSDPLAMLRMIITNPQLQQALQQSTMGPSAPRAISLPVPAPTRPSGSRQMSIPLGAVMNAIYALAGQSMEQLNANTREDDPEVPEYLVGEDGEFLVDPASSEERARLVTEWFEMSENARRRPARRRRQSSEFESDESERWAIEAGFTR